MSKPCFLGIDTSNYTTSISLASEDGEIVANIKKLLPVKAGERGLRQSDAVFAHIKNLPELCGMLRKKLSELDLSPLAVGYSATPRDAEGSYMPCFLVGGAVASAVSATLGVPLIANSHQSGHIMAAAYSCGESEKLLSADFAAFHVSGGTTELLYVTPEPEKLNVKLIGETKDLNAGQAIDRIGVRMGLGFPCGREMELLARECSEKFFRHKISVSGYNCNLSGLENMANALISQEKEKSYVSAFVFDYVGTVLANMTENLRTDYPDIPVLYSGGVMSNKLIQKKLSLLGNVYFSEPEFSSDNAAGVALLTRRKFLFDNI